MHAVAIHMKTNMRIPSEAPMFSSVWLVMTTLKMTAMAVPMIDATKTRSASRVSKRLMKMLRKRWSGEREGERVTGETKSKRKEPQSDVRKKANMI